MTMPKAKSLRTPWRSLYASLRNLNAHGHLRRARLCETLQKYPQINSLRTPWRSLGASLRNLNAHGHLRRARLRETLPKKTQINSLRTPWRSFAASLRNRHANGHLRRACLCETLQGNTPDQELENPMAQPLCEPAQSKCKWTSQKSLFTRDFAKKTQIKSLRTPWRSLYGSLRNRHANGHLRRACLRETLQRKNPDQELENPVAQPLWEPAQPTCKWTFTAKNAAAQRAYRDLTCKNPSMLTHWLGNAL